MDDLWLGIDIGTSASKGVVVDRSGTILASSRRGHGTSSPRPGWFEQDAETVWWHDFRELSAELVAATPGRPATVAVSGLGPCLLPVDADGRALRPAILYGIDTRATAEIAALEAELGTERILARAGSMLTGQAVGPKLLWLRNDEPEVYRRTAMVFSAASYLVYRLTGEYVLDHHTASQWTPLYDLDGQCWNTRWSESIAPGLSLPALRWASEVVGSVTEQAATETGLPQGIPVTAGTVDAWAEAASVGVRRPGEVMVMYGTTMFLVEATARAARHRGLWSTAGLRPGSHTLAAGMATSGSLTEWLAALTGAAVDDLTVEAAQSPPGAHGLLMLPYFAGERTPLFDPWARGAVLGLTLAHHRGDLYRAALEATAFGVRHNLDAMSEATGGADRALTAVGGGTTGGLWPQIVSDVTGLSQRLPAQTVGACLGDALLGAMATGREPDIDRWNPTASVVAPDHSTRGLYDARYADYREFYSATADIAHRLAAAQLRGAR
ncbi:FGGY-family carbohydrate kinase [Speluncibacter jeojiensis]|uniref:FGGY family carbohydrate kinase n=1 Tax=Speluncibacter jeojiensis TaxID=2710754 RepID=A0A9X4RI43_9ACTN|nr:FGGY family carbohydrate kinase [Corynebacteriales bacterium D3-21]